jgi:hypothetical protein
MATHTCDNIYYTPKRLIFFEVQISVHFVYIFEYSNVSSMVVFVILSSSSTVCQSICLAMYHFQLENLWIYVDDILYVYYGTGDKFKVFKFLQ